MKFKLSQILESTILLEGRKEDTLKKYGEEHSELIDMLSEVDPSGNNKYINWAMKQVVDNKEDFMIVSSLLNKFHTNSQRLEKKDINQYIEHYLKILKYHV
jgi:spore coat polysaccharide biosynthesis protein SpsF (cytidylyltransferase family)